MGGMVCTQEWSEVGGAPPIPVEQSSGEKSSRELTANLEDSHVIEAFTSQVESRVVDMTKLAVALEIG
jgi:hypothetical protein